MKYLHFLLCCFFLLTLCGCRRPNNDGIGQIKDLQVESNALSFLVVGDWGRNGYFNQGSVADQMNVAAKQLKADFVISTGDNFYDNGVQSIDDPLWHSSFEDVYTGKYLAKKWYVVLGNHDYRGNAQAEIDYSRKSQRWTLPSRYYAVETSTPLDTLQKARVLLVFVDTSPFESEYYRDKRHHGIAEQDTTAQLHWIDSTLTASQARWKIVIGHHPVYTTGERLGHAKDTRHKLEPLLIKHGVDAYFCGHEHDLQHLKTPGSNVHYFISGAGSMLRPTGRTEITLFSRSTHGFMTVSLTDNVMLVQVVDFEGHALYNTRITKTNVKQ